MGEWMAKPLNCECGRPEAWGGCATPGKEGTGTGGSKEWPPFERVPSGGI
jgi:hypothetical protein